MKSYSSPTTLRQIPAFSLKICSLEVCSRRVNRARNNTYFAKSKRRYFFISPTTLPPGQDRQGLKGWTCPTTKTEPCIKSVCMSEHRHSCCGSPAVYRDQSPSHDVLWLVCKEAIVGSANVVGNSLHPFWFQNKDPSTVSQTSLAGFKLHQRYMIFCS